MRAQSVQCEAQGDMLVLRLFRICLLGCSLWWGRVDSDDCVRLEASDVILNVPPGMVCIECVFNGVVANDTEFQIDNSDIDTGVEDGVLVVLDTENVFNTSTSTNIRCSSSVLRDEHSAIVFLNMFRPPEITGETIVNEGDMLDLDCDSSNSRPNPSVQWFNAEGDMITSDRKLNITNIQQNEMGIYTCVATQLGITMNNSVNVIVQFTCIVLMSTTNVIVNLTSTAMGSNATYQCRDNPSDVYTTQCASDGVWEPDLNTLDCRFREPELTEDLQPSVQIVTPADNMTDAVLHAGMLVAIIIIVTVVMLMCIAVVAVTIFLWRRKSRNRLKRRFQMTENCYMETPATTQLESIGQYSVVQQEQELSAVFIEQTSMEQPVQERVSGDESSGEAPSQPPPVPPHSPIEAPVKSLIYAEVGPHVCSAPRPPHLQLQTEKVQYATLLHNAIVEPLPSELEYSADHNVGLDQILIQLREVAPHWRRLAEAVGLEDLQRIAEHVNSDSEAMVEVVDSWLAKLYPKAPTWREIADVVEHIDHSSLANSIRQVYITGVLPIEVSSAVPDTQTLLNAISPPLPPRDTDDGGTPQSPPPDNDSVEQLPMKQVQTYRH